MTHTPGPWTIYEPELDITAYDEAADRTVTVAMMCDDASSEREANAALIAAAPELLEALKAVVLAVANNPTGGPWEQVAAAIAAAEGE